MELSERGLINLIEENTLPLENFLELMETSPLGDGEIECIALANLLNMGVCSDDRKARLLASAHRGEQNVIGSIRLLRWCVEAEIITCTNAFEIFQNMLESGGFLPQTSQDFFCLDVG